MPQLQQILAPFVPEAALNYTVALQDRYGFYFILAKARKSKWGDFRASRSGETQITVNANLNPYNFLITYIHEVAHCAVYEQYGFRVAPHGKEWKALFSDLLRPVLLPSIFPEEKLPFVKKFALAPKASVNASRDLHRALDDEKHLPAGKVYLKELPRQATFAFQNQLFQKIEVRRTRSLCLDLRSQKKYTISEWAEVAPVTH